MSSDMIMEFAREIREELIKIRREIHSHPELAFEEVKTAKLVAEELSKLGIEVQRNVGGTGVVGLLRGKYEGKTILLRADMDALPLEELNDIEYKSQNKGVMHACGHDAHTTWVLGAAMILNKLRDELHGNVKFVFQPAEEIGGGAEKMVEDGVMENPHVDFSIGAHVWSQTVEDGKIGIKYGPLCAAPDYFKITVKGKGGHCAYPHKCVDPISVMCQIYTSLQTVISRRIDPLEPVLISVCKFNAGTSFNIVPDDSVIEGTIRTLNRETRKKIPEIIENIVKGITAANAADYNFEYIPYYPPLINDDKISGIIEKSAQKVMGNDNVVRIEKPVMGGEDFAYFQDDVPGAFFIVGTTNPEKGYDKPLHSANFNLDEEIIYKASAVFAQAVVDILNS